MTPPRPLLAERRFAPLFWCQFLSAFNDNLLKNALVFLLLWGVGGEGTGALVALASAVFIAPFFLLSGLAGEMADRFDKALLARRLKGAEIAVAGVAALGFLLPSAPLLFAALAGFGTVSALFGPVKYAILPDHLPRERLTAANALVEFATFAAILGGTIAGGLAVGGGGGAVPSWLVGGSVVACAVLSWLAARLIPPTGEAAPDLAVRRNILASTLDLLRELRADRRVWRASLITTWFWLAGSVALALLPSLVKDVLGGTEAAATLALCVFSVGIGAGSALAADVAGGRIVMLPSVLGAALMGAALLDLWWTTRGLASPAPAADLSAFLARPGAVRSLIDLALVAVAGGLVVVPAFAAVQAWSGAERRARAVAGVNVLSSGAMAGGALVLALAQHMGLGAPALLGLLGAASLLAAALMLAALPTNPARDGLWMLFRVLYRLEVRGAEHLAAAGPRSVVALNHVSWLDATLAVALLEREPVFAIDSGVARRRWVRPALRLFRALPLDPTKPFATRTLIQAVQGGETLVIFPEGRLTVTGSMMKVYDGAALVADKAGAEVFPVRIEGLEATPFTRLRPGQVRRLFPKVVVTALEPTRLALDPALVGRKRREAGGAALQGVMSDLIWRTTPIDRTVFEAVAAAAARHGRGRAAVEDPLSGKLSYRRLLAGAAVLGRELAPLAAEGEAVGVLLPTANGAAATVLGLVSAGRVPAMLNFTAGAANLRAACAAAKVGAVVTSRRFLKGAKLGALAEELGRDARVIYLEDVGAGIGALDRLRGLLRGGRPLAPGRRPDDPAVILFTSGSEGMPKGVVLSHRNLLANAAQAAARIDFGREDKVFNALPVFHSFGLTAGLVLPLVSGVPAFLYPSPLHYRVVPELIYGSNATILFGTDTFLAGYARTAHAYDLRSVRYVLAGAEPVKPSTREVWLEKFGLRVLEGYGVTETAPILALNTPMANRFGTVGRLVPGIEARLDPVPGIEDGGRLRVRGPNVMLGYLHADRPGELDPPPGGWHDTGDIVSIDAQGFVRIRGRAKRFAKIGGEMVSLAAVEALAAELWPGAASAAASLPDGRKGERVVLLTEQPGATRAAFSAHARSKGAAELMVPAEVRVVRAVPLLGSGKTDFAAVCRMADAAAVEHAV